MTPTIGLIETKIGTVRYNMTNGDHVYLCSVDGARVTIRGIPYHVAYHLNLIEGEWNGQDHHALYLDRKDDWRKQTSTPARKTAAEILAAAWAAFIVEHPDLIGTATGEKLAEEETKLAEEVAGLEEKLAAKRKELADKRAEIQAHAKRGAA
jgi:hypothetical protein